MVLQVTYLKIMWQEKKTNQTKKIKKTTQKMKNIRNEKLDQKNILQKDKTDVLFSMSISQEYSFILFFSLLQSV